jgi:hypothetical protein
MTLSFKLNSSTVKLEEGSVKTLSCLPARATCSAGEKGRNMGDKEERKERKEQLP